MRRWMNRGRVSARTTAMGAATLLLVTLAACGGDGEANNAGGQSDYDPDDVCTAERVDPNSTLRIDTTAPTTSLDPKTAAGGIRGAEETAALYDTLTRYNPESGRFEPYLAESLTPNDDFTEWTMTLREGVTFGNGDAMTAEDVKYSIERMKTATGSIVRYMAPLETVDVVDELTVKFSLNRAWAGFPWILSDTAGMVVNQTIVEARNGDLSLNPEGAGVGPFELVKFAPNEEVVMKARTDYWGGPVCVGTLRFVSIPGAASKVEAFENREIDVVTMEANPNFTRRIGDMDDVNTLEHERSAAGLGLNSHAGRPLSDVRLRKAVVSALDPDVINQRAFKGDGIMAKTLTTPNSEIWGGVEGPKYDVDEAKRLVAEAKADGANVTVDFLTNDTQDPEFLLVVEALLENVGFQVNAETLPYSAYLEQLLASNFDIVISTSGIIPAVPIRAMSAYLSGDSGNVWGFNDDRLDSVINEFYLADGAEETAAVVGELQELWNELAPSAPIWVTSVTKGFRNKVRGVQPAGEGWAYYSKAYIAE